MICKDDICDVFKELCSAERIDLLCGMLQLCVPLELRFVGSYLEELARKDYASLADYEQKANDSSVLKTLDINGPGDVADCQIASVLNVYLSLLHSDNSNCAHVLFGLLTRLEHVVENTYRTGQPFPDGDIETESDQPPSENCLHSALDLVLLFTMAMHHPAFTFSHRHQLYGICQNVERLVRYRPSYKLANIQTNSASDSTVASIDDSCNSFAIPSQSQSSSNYDSLSVGSETYIKNIQVKQCQVKTGQKQHEYNLEVTWSDGIVAEVTKSYHELQSFHAELVRLFPKESGAPKEERSLPFFPQEQRSTPHTAEMMVQRMNQYYRKLSTQSEHIMQCEPMATFFRRPSNTGSSLLATSLSTSVTVTASCSVHTSTVIPAKPNDVIAACVRPIAHPSSIRPSASVPDIVGRPRPWVKSSYHSAPNGMRPLPCSGVTDHTAVILNSLSPSSQHSSLPSSTSSPLLRSTLSHNGFAGNHVPEPLPLPAVDVSTKCSAETKMTMTGIVKPMQVIESGANDDDTCIPFLSSDDPSPPAPVDTSHSSIFDSRVLDGACATDSAVPNGTVPDITANVVPVNFVPQINGAVPVNAGVILPSPALNEAPLAVDVAPVECTHHAPAPAPVGISPPNPELLRWPNCQPVDSRPVFFPVPLAVPVHGDVVACYANPSLGCMLGGYNPNRQMCDAGFNQTARDVAPPARELTPLSALPPPPPPVNNVHGFVATPARMARPILGAAANLNLPQASEKSHSSPSASWEQSSGNISSTKLGPVISPVNEDGISLPGNGNVASVPPVPLAPSRPPSNSDTYQNGQQRANTTDNPSARPVGNQLPPSSSPPSSVLMWANGETGYPVAIAGQTPAPLPAVSTPPIPLSSTSCGHIATVSNAANSCCSCSQCQLPGMPPVGSFTAYNFPPMLFQGAGPIYPSFGYASLSFPPPPLTHVPFTATFSQSGELMFANQPMFAVVPHPQRPPPPVPAHGPPGTPLPSPIRGHRAQHAAVLNVPFNPSMPPPFYHVSHGPGKRAGKNASCFNCGMVGHQASRCPEPQISSSIPLGQFRLNCVPKSSKSDDSSHRSSPRQQ